MQTFLFVPFGTTDYILQAEMACDCCGVYNPGLHSVNVPCGVRASVITASSDNVILCATSHLVATVSLSSVSPVKLDIYALEIPPLLVISCSHPQITTDSTLLFYGIY